MFCACVRGANLFMGQSERALSPMGTHGSTESAKKPATGAEGADMGHTAKTGDAEYILIRNMHYILSNQWRSMIDQWSKYEAIPSKYVLNIKYHKYVHKRNPQTLTLKIQLPFSLMMLFFPLAWLSFVFILYLMAAEPVNLVKPMVVKWHGKLR